MRSDNPSRTGEFVLVVLICGLAALALGIAAAVAVSVGRRRVPGSAPWSLRGSLERVGDVVQHVMVLGGAVWAVRAGVDRFRRHHVVVPDAVAVGVAIVAALTVYAALVVDARRRGERRLPPWGRRAAAVGVTVAVAGLLVGAGVNDDVCDVGKPQAEPPIAEVVLEPSSGAVLSANPAVVSGPEETPPVPMPPLRPGASGDAAVGKLAVGGCLTPKPSPPSR